MCAEGRALYLGWPGGADWNTCAGRRVRLLPKRLAGTLQGARVGARRYTSARSHRSEVQHCTALQAIRPSLLHPAAHSCTYRGMKWRHGQGAARMHTKPVTMHAGQSGPQHALQTVQAVVSTQKRCQAVHFGAGSAIPVTARSLAPSGICPSGGLC